MPWFAVEEAPDSELKEKEKKEYEKGMEKGKREEGDEKGKESEKKIEEVDGGKAGKSEAVEEEGSAHALVSSFVSLLSSPQFQVFFKEICFALTIV